MLLDKIIELKGGQSRQIQQNLTQDMLNNPEGVALFNAGTGIGKTLAYLSAQIEIGGKTIIAVPNHQLAKQVINDINWINSLADELEVTPVKAQVRTGLQEYISPLRTARLHEYFTQECSESQAMLWDKLFEASKAPDDSNLVGNFLAEYGDLPKGITISDINCSSEDKSSMYLSMERTAEKSADILIITHISLLAKNAFKSLPDSFLSHGRLIVDEADSLVQTAQSLYSRRISVRAITRKADLSKKIEKATNKLLDGIDHLKDGLYFFNEHPNLWFDLTNLTEEVSSELGVHQYTDQLTRFCELGITNASISIDGDKATLLQLSRFAAQVFKDRIVDMNSVWLLSGTLDITANKETSANWLSKKLGIEDVNYFYRHYEPRNYGKASFKLGRGPKPIKCEEISEEFINYCAESVNKTMLICTGSHDESHQLANAIRLDRKIAVIEDRPGESLTKLIAEFQHSEKPSVLITARASVGTDIRAIDGTQLFSAMMITRLPFAPPVDRGDIEWRASMHGSSESKIASWEYQDSLQTSVRRFIQSFGRGIRSENDMCEFLIMDCRMPTADESHRNSIFRDALPSRFWMNYMEAEFIHVDTAQSSAPQEMFL